MPLTAANIETYSGNNAREIRYMYEYVFKKVLPLALYVTALWLCGETPSCCSGWNARRSM